MGGVIISFHISSNLNSFNLISSHVIEPHLILGISVIVMLESVDNLAFRFTTCGFINLLSPHIKASWSSL